ncbi:MAG: hypothetical protein LC730_06890 [Acidobacteria bacterium]|nr:hypothetical protein [Acidobacteriota bacterium]
MLGERTQIGPQSAPLRLHLRVERVAPQKAIYESGAIENFGHVDVNVSPSVEVGSQSIGRNLKITDKLRNTIFAICIVDTAVIKRIFNCPLEGIGPGLNASKQNIRLSS